MNLGLFSKSPKPQKLLRKRNVYGHIVPTNLAKRRLNTAFFKNKRLCRKQTAATHHLWRPANPVLSDLRQAPF